MCGVGMTNSAEKVDNCGNGARTWVEPTPEIWGPAFTEASYLSSCGRLEARQKCQRKTTTASNIYDDVLILTTPNLQ